MTRQTKTPQQRAQEQLDTATRITDRLNKRVGETETELRELKAARDDAVRRRDFLAQHPDLQPEATDDPLPEPPADE